MTLWPILPFDPEETLPSYADRLSMWHTGRGLERLLKDTGIDYDHFVSGRHDAVTSFAEATGLSQHEAQSNAIRAMPRGGEFRGEATSKLFLLPQAKRYCPVCLEENDGPNDWRYQLLWGFRHVERCDRHGVWLVPTHDVKATTLRRALLGIPLAEPSEIKGETPSYLSWLRARVHGSATEMPWLKQQTLDQVLVASELIGAILEYGHKVKPTKLSSTEIETATNTGFSVFSEGPAAIEEALDTIRRTSPARAVQAGPLAYYGSLYIWLDRRSNFIDPGPIRDLLRNHIVKHLPIEPGTTVLGVKITERRLHTLHSLSAAVGIERSRLSRLLKKLGEIPADATGVQAGNLVFEVDKTTDLIETFTTSIRLRDLPEYLGATKRQVERLYRAGVIKPLVPRTERGEVRNVVFARAHLDDLLQQVADLPILDVAETDNVYPIAYVCQRGAGTFEDLFQEILRGHVPAFRRPGNARISAICIDVSCVSSLGKSG